MRLDPLVNNGSSKTVVPMLMVRVRFEQDRCTAHCGEFPGHAMRPEPNVEQPLQDCRGAARLLVNKLFRD